MEEVRLAHILLERYVQKKSSRLEKKNKVAGSEEGNENGCIVEE